MNIYKSLLTSTVLFISTCTTALHAAVGSVSLVVRNMTAETLSVQSTVLDGFIKIKHLQINGLDDQTPAVTIAPQGRATFVITNSNMAQGRVIGGIGICVDSLRACSHFSMTAATTENDHFVMMRDDPVSYSNEKYLMGAYSEGWWDGVVNIYPAVQSSIAINHL